MATCVAAESRWARVRANEMLASTSLVNEDAARAALRLLVELVATERVADGADEVRVLRNHVVLPVARELDLLPGEVVGVAFALPDAPAIAFQDLLHQR